MNVVDINYEEGTLSEHPPPEAVSRYCGRILSFLTIDNWELSVLFCSDHCIQQLNRKYRNRDNPTDILSFPQTETEHGEGGHAGDIVISLDTLERNAEEYDITRDEELKRLLVHGILHLTGMDHTYEHIDKQEMIQKQEHILHSVNGVLLF